MKEDGVCKGNWKGMEVRFAEGIQWLPHAVNTSFLCS